MWDNAKKAQQITTAPLQTRKNVLVFLMGNSYLYATNSLSKGLELRLKLEVGGWLAWLLFITTVK